MSFKRFAAVCTAAVLAGWAATAVAADQEYGRSGPYLGAGGTYGFENFDGVPGAGGGWGYNLKGGYRFNQFFAIEAEFEQLLGMESNLGDIDSWVLTAAGKAFALDGPIQPFALAGIGWAGVDQSGAGGVDDDGLGFRFGAGVDFYATRNIAITAEVGYILGTGDVGDFNLVPVSLGVLYRFY